MRWIAALSTLFVLGTAYAASEADLLPPEQAFVVEAHADDQGAIKARWIIAEGYYLYRERLSFEIETPGYQLGTPSYPTGKIKDDPFFGRTETYRHEVRIDLPIQRTDPGGATLILIARSQGCADLGVCYPPQERRVTIDLPRQSQLHSPLAPMIAAN